VFLIVIILYNNQMSIW